MKTLIQTSIQIYGMGHPDTKTLFQLVDATPPANPTPEQIKESVKKKLANQKILNDIRYESLTAISGRKLTVWFSYEENGKTVDSSVQMTVPVSNSEDVIKEAVLAAIETKLK